LDFKLGIRRGGGPDPAAPAAVVDVDAARLKVAEKIYREMGLTPKKARARAVLLYSFVFGQSLILLEQTPNERASLTAACAEVLIEYSSRAET
jgi:hypothetical protein